MSDSEMTSTQVEVCPQNVRDKSVIWNLFQFYCYDTSVEDNYDVEKDGLFSLSADYFRQYWEAPRWSAHLLRVDGAIAGFVLIEPSEELADAQELADLFILKRYRRMGIGLQVVRHFMRSRISPWTVTVLREWGDATRFWDRVLCLPEFSVSGQLPDSLGRKADVYVLPPNAA
jgi:predicted acetyltransferase